MAGDLGENLPTPPLTRGWGFFIKGPQKITIKIANIDYDTANFSDEAKAQLVSLQFSDKELASLQAQAAAIQTARMAYAKALQAALPAMPAGDTLKFN